MNNCDEFTHDDFLRGQLKIMQPVHGFRAGMDSLLLAASIPAVRGDTVLELGMGPGVAALCLAYRTQANIIGIENNENAIYFAQKNIYNNKLDGLINVIHADATLLKSFPQRGFDHVMMNPPFYSSIAHQKSPDSHKANAMNMSDEALKAWINTGIVCLKPKGSFTLIIPPDRLHTVLETISPRLGAIQILPIHTKLQAPANRVLIHAKKGRKTPLILLYPFLTTDNNTGMSTAMRAIAENAVSLNVFN